MSSLSEFIEKMKPIPNKLIKKVLSDYKKKINPKAYSKLKREDLLKLLHDLDGKLFNVSVFGNGDGTHTLRLTGAEQGKATGETKLKKKREPKKKEPKKKEPKKTEPKEEPKKVLEYERAWAEGTFNSSQRVLISKMTDERREEVLKILGLKEEKEKSLDLTLKEVEDFYEDKAIDKPVPYTCSVQSGTQALLLKIILDRHTSDCEMFVKKNGKRKVVLLRVIISSKKAKNPKIIRFNYEDADSKENLMGDEKFYNDLGLRFLECKKNNKSVVIPYSFNISGDSGGHANMLIFNHKRNEVEHFEPHGNRADHLTDEQNKVLEDFDKMLVEKVNEVIKNNSKKPFELKYVLRGDICPVGFKSFQGHENKDKQKGSDKLSKVGGIKDITVINDSGYCCAWSMLYLDFRLRTLKKPADEVYKKIIEKYGVRKNDDTNYKKLKSWIRGLTNILYENYIEIVKEVQKENNLSDENIFNVLLFVLFGGKQVKSAGYTIDHGSLNDTLELIQQKVEDKISRRDIIKSKFKLSQYSLSSLY